MADWLTAFSSATTSIPPSDCASAFETSALKSCEDVSIETRDRLRGSASANNRLSGVVELSTDSRASVSCFGFAVGTGHRSRRGALQIGWRLGSQLSWEHAMLRLEIVVSSFFTRPMRQECIKNSNQ